jgi:hypothetical protein
MIIRQFFTEENALTMTEMGGSTPWGRVRVRRNI